MRQVNFFLFWASISLIFFLSCKETSSELSLAGEWQFALDPADVGIGQEWQNKDLEDVVCLPGSYKNRGKAKMSAWILDGLDKLSIVPGIMLPNMPNTGNRAISKYLSG